MQLCKKLMKLEIVFDGPLSVSANMRALCLLALGLYRLPYTRQQEDFQFGVGTRPTTTLVFYAPNPGLDPYWQRGEWVFGDPNSNNFDTTIGTPKKHSARFLVCGRLCPRVFRKLTGGVCVHQLNNVYAPTYNGDYKKANPRGFIDWRLGGVLDRNYDYLRDFSSYCAFLDAQCRTHVAHGYGYAFLHMGPCMRDEDTWSNLLHGNDLRQRKVNALYYYGQRTQYPDTKNGQKCGMPSTYDYYYEDRIRETGSCYWLPTDSYYLHYWQRQWWEALHACESVNANLAVLDDENERRVVMDLIQGDQYKYINLLTDFIYVGITLNSNYEWVAWEDRESTTLDEVGYAPWAPGQPDNAEGNEWYVALHKRTGLYHDVRVKKLNFLCERKASSELLKYT